MNQLSEGVGNIQDNKDFVSATNDAKKRVSVKTNGGRILIVDDEIDICTLFSNALSRIGFEVETYNDPEMALSNYRPGVYDLLISDIRMPRMNGFELCREIKKRDEKIKVCFMTAFEIHPKEFEKVLPSIKVDEFITKPIGINKLGATVQRLLLRQSAVKKHDSYQLI